MLSERGSAVVESLFATVFIMFLVLGVIQVAFTLYARNIVLSSAHEGARAAAEYRSSAADAALAARTTVETSAGALVRDLEVAVEVVDGAGATEIITVQVSGRARSFGPVPFPVTLTATATSSRETDIP